MSLNFVPGIDFSINEVVTANKLRIWINGTRNTETLTGTDIGLSGFDLSTAATWASNATQGEMYYDTTLGQVLINSRWGWVPIFGTDGGLFTRRHRFNPDNRDTEAVYFHNYGTHELKSQTAGANTHTLGTSAYSAGLVNDCFGACLSGQEGSACVWDRKGEAVTTCAMASTRWPTLERHNTTGHYTDMSASTGQTGFHHCFQIGGWVPVQCTTRSGYTQSSMTMSRVGVAQWWQYNNVAPAECHSWSPGTQAGAMYNGGGGVVAGVPGLAWGKGFRMYSYTTDGYGSYY